MSEHSMTEEDKLAQVRELTAEEKEGIKIKIFAEVIAKTKPATFEIVSPEKIKESIDLYLNGKMGINPAQIAIVLKNINLFCEKCGQCCRNCNPIGLLDQEAYEIMVKYGKSYVKCVDNRFYFSKVNPCTFLKHNRCSIYNSRPSSCRIYPFFLKNGILIPIQFGHCKVAFNIAVFQIVSWIAFEWMSIKHPEIIEQMTEFGRQKFAILKGKSPLEQIVESARIFDDIKGETQSCQKE